MCSNTTDEIDAIALAVEDTIAQNEVALSELEESYTEFSEFQVSPAPGMDAPDAEELFS